MNSILKKLLISTLISFGFGAAMVVPVVTSEKGWVAGIVSLLLVLLVAIICLILFIAGIAFLIRENPIGLYLLLAVLLVPAGFFSASFTAKKLELGAYREEPMRPIVAAIANKVLFKKEATHDEIERFKTDVIGGPAVGDRADKGEENGYRAVVFEFRSDATDEQNNDIRERINNYQSVHQYLENVDTTAGPVTSSPPGPGLTKSR